MALMDLVCQGRNDQSFHRMKEEAQSDLLRKNTWPKGHFFTVAVCGWDCRIWKSLFKLSDSECLEPSLSLDFLCHLICSYCAVTCAFAILRLKY